jgi:hypothetical protein
MLLTVGLPLILGMLCGILTQWWVWQFTRFPVPWGVRPFRTLMTFVQEIKISN